MNRASEFHIDFPQPTADNISERRAELLAKLSDRMNIGIVGCPDAIDLFPNDFASLTEAQIAREKQILRMAIKFAAGTVGVLIALLAAVSLR